MTYNCIISYCKCNASYNYKNSNNPAYCYIHKDNNMIKFGNYNLDDFLEIIFYSFEKILK